ncbi:MAG: hypothetical protein HQK53_03670 [Oligoflexia bacterium]|nr:hypothetical protein [Oligoflexia bacterium]
MNHNKLVLFIKQINSKKEVIFFYSGIAYLLLFYAYPMVKHWNEGGIEDWNGFEAFSAILRYFYLKFHTFPLWDPYRLGGYPYLANPEQHAFSPFVIFELIFGVHGGLKINIFLHVLIGYMGTYLWLKKSNEKFSPLVLMLASIIYSTTGHFVAHISVGHWGWLAFMYWPWIILGLYHLNKIGDSYWFLLLFFYCLLFTIGSPNFLVYTLILSFFTLIFNYLKLTLNKDIFIYRLTTIIFLLLLILIISSPSYITSFSWMMIKNPRIMMEKENLNIINIINQFFIPLHFSKDTLFQAQKYQNHEYFNYINIVTMFFFCYSFSTQKMRDLLYKQQYLIWMGVFGLILSLGNFHNFAPYTLLHKLPPFSSTRVPFRYILLTIPAIIFFSSVGLQSIIEKIDSRLWSNHNKIKYGIFFLLLVVIFFLNIPTQKFFDRSWVDTKNITALSKLDYPTRNFQQAINPKFLFREKILNPYTGILNCVISFHVPIGRLNIGPLNLWNKESIITDWTPNSVIINADIHSDVIHLNMNCDSRWKINNGNLKCNNGRPMIMDFDRSLPIILQYQDKILFFSIIISLCVFTVVLLAGGHKLVRTSYINTLIKKIVRLFRYKINT